jgi:amino acid adenylation domain-containing protein
MLEDSRALVLLTSERLSAGPLAHGIRTVCVDAEQSGIERGPDETPTSGVTADNLAYVMYTSGSTGKPKGVAIEHRNTVTLLNWVRQSFEPEDLAGVLFSTSICFDLSIFELFAPLSVGGKIILVENVLQLSSVPPDRNITLVNTVPSAISELLRDGGLPPSVRTVSLCGEPLLETVVEQIRQNKHVEKIINLYGPTECTTYSTWSLIGRDACGTPTIGRPISNTRIYVLDRTLQPVPVGIPGELYIGGSGVARGYLGRPELTAERFVPDPFDHEPVSRLYRTGDLGRYLPCGDLEFLGRMDQQVKIRGFRVELGEIETVLCRHPDVREAAVVARGDLPGEKRLVAYIVPERARKPTPAELREHLARAVPDYMVPAAFTSLDALPLTPNGKVDRKALPPPAAIGPPSGPAYAAPGTPTEELLAAIWANVLKVERVGIHDNFFELGGNSLLVLRLVSQIRKDFEVALPLNVVFEAPTIEQMSAVLHRELSVVSAGPLSSRNEVRDTPFFCLSWGPTLAGHLNGYPVYPLDPHPTETGAITSIEDTASSLVERLRGVQPQGPYLLGGFCRMGVLAFEMAQQLLASGQEAALLVLFDAPPLTLREHRQGFVRRSSKRVGKLVTLLRRWTSGDPAVRFGDVLRTVRNRAGRLIDDLPLPVARRIAGEAAMDLIPKQLIDRYEPRDYPGQIKLVRPIENAAGPDWDPARSWGSLARGGLDVWDVPGNHVSMFEKPNVQILAARLRPHLEEANEVCRRAHMGRQGVNSQASSTAV